MNSLQELKYPIEYYCDEVREGFFVSETMKRYWAAQLVVLAEVDKICKRHDINWYADSGTMLGAIRHKGYIPWDDDLDIAMFRKDYKRFLKYAKDELPEGFRLLSSENEKWEMAFGRVVNNDELGLHPDFLNRFHGCPFAVGIDIFPLDNIYDDKAMEKNRTKRADKIMTTFLRIRGKCISKKEVEKLVDQIEFENDCIIDKKNTLRSLLLLFEEVAQECRDDNSSEIAVMNEWIPESRCRYFRSYYDEWKNMPFESTMLRLPVRYDDILKAYYGDYMKPVRGQSDHEYPIYRKQERFILSKVGKYPTCRYHFEKESFNPGRSRKNFLIQQKELLSYMCGFHENIRERICSGKIDEAVRFLETCQNAAVTIGNALEGKYGEDTEAVHALEAYCEKVYQASVAWNDDSKTELDKSLEAAKDRIEELYDSSPKEILFLLCKASWWDSVKDVYAGAMEDDGKCVKAMPIPYSYIDNAKNLVGWRSDLEEFEKNPELAGRITNLDDYILGKRHPDKIVIQCPYDGFSGILAIPEALFSEKLLDYTDELIYVPFLEPDPPESTEDVAYAALQELIEQPAIFNADKILLGSEQLRDYYIQKLVDMTDENLREYWKQRICLKEIV